ncbi:MAG: DUF1761 domain-containing protein [Planctomycetota bacterium]|jgi:hypothetical protein
MHMDFSNLNWLAIVVATIAMFIIGGAWYGAIFAKSWATLHELSEARVASATRRFPMNMGAILVGDFLRAIVLALLIGSLHTSGIAHGLHLGFLVWLGFSLTYDVAWALSSSTTPKAFIIDSSYRLVCLLVAGVILASWQKDVVEGAGSLPGVGG